MANELRIFLPILITLLALGSCRQAERTTAPSPQPFVADIKVIGSGVGLQDAPGTEGTLLANLPSGTLLEDQAQTSPFLTEVTIAGIPYYEPWIKVALQEGRTGWVYAAPVSIQPTTRLSFEQWIIPRRLEAIWGPWGLERIEQHIEDFGKAITAGELAYTYEKASALRDTLVQVIESTSLQKDEESMPNLFWLADAIPGLVPQLVAEGTTYYLFFDYKKWGEKARSTTGSEDDAFMTIQYQLFPVDSIEYFFPAWTMQTWDYGGHSLLGRGIHHQILDQLDQFDEQTDLFDNAINQIKRDLVEDITRPEVTFWEPAAMAMNELDSILAADYSFFTPEERIGLQTRREQFDEPDKFGIQFNHKAGIYN